MVTVNLMGAKVMPLGTLFGMQFNISVAIFLMPILFTIIDVVSEVYGRERARSLIRCGLIVIVVLVFYMMLATALPFAPRWAANEPSYDLIFGMSIRFAIASVLAFGFSEFLDIAIYNRLRAKSGNRLVWLRSNLSNFINEFIDSALFMTIAFYSFAMAPMQNATWLMGLILPYWIAKCIMSVVGTPLMYAGIRFVRRYKETDTSKEASVLNG